MKSLGFRGQVVTICAYQKLWRLRYILLKVNPKPLAKLEFSIIFASRCNKNVSNAEVAELVDLPDGRQVRFPPSEFGVRKMDCGKCAKAKIVLCVCSKECKAQLYLCWIN
jgi:hypothetical protein